MRRKSSLWKTTAVSLSAMMTLSMGAAVLAAGTEQTTHESQTEDNTENKSADTDEASNTAETKTEECKIELSDNGILVDGEAISFINSCTNAFCLSLFNSNTALALSLIHISQWQPPFHLH